MSPGSIGIVTKGHDSQFAYIRPLPRCFGSTPRSWIQGDIDFYTLSKLKRPNYPSTGNSVAELAFHALRKCRRKGESEITAFLVNILLDSKLILVH